MAVLGVLGVHQQQLNKGKNPPHPHSSDEVIAAGTNQEGVHT